MNKFYLKDAIESFMRQFGGSITREQLEMLTAVDCEVVRFGTWEMARNFGDYPFYRCSNCKKWNISPSAYCPRCGTKMKFDSFGDKK